MADSFVECLADGECPYCEQYPDAASNSTVTDSEIGSDEATEEPSETESTGSEEPSSDVESGVTIMPSPASSMSSDSVPPTKSPSLTAMPSSDVSGSPSMIEASNATDATATPSLTSTLSPSTIDVENTSNTSAIPTSVGNETIVETIEPTALATENSTTLVPTTLAPTGTPSVSLLPSLSPTTLKPTMGPCDGDSCPGEMCRSFYGFCGSGPSYCDENPIWTPECGDKSKVPSPTPTIVMEDVPTMPPVDLDSVFSTDGSTATPSAAMPSKESSFIKPSGGKKPPPSSSKTSSSPTVDGEILTDSPTLSVETDSPTQGTASPTPVPTEIVFSPTDPEATYFCGTDWDDANASCLIRCPSSKSEDCPSDQKCFAFTSCMDKDTDKFELTPDEVTSTDAEPDEVTSTDAEPNEVTSADATTEATNNESCNGKPCPFAGECRSQYGFCGKSFIYCNDMSSWTLEACGLVGSAKNGDPIKCDTKVFECPDGDEVYKDPANACEFFPCPDDEEEESAITSTSFHTPGLSPSQSSPADMPALPKPTLPTISNASPFTNSAASGSSNTTIDLGKQPVASDSAVMTVVVNSDITDDEDQTSTTESAQNGGSVAPAPSQEPLTPFLAEEWLMSSSILNRGVNYLLWSMVTLSACVLSI